MDKKWLKRIAGEMLETERPNRLSYIPYTDNAGNRLTEEDILYTNEEGFRGKQRLALWTGEQKATETYTVSSPGVKLIYDNDIGNFPVALMSPEGDLMYLKVSRYTGEVLPMHAGCCQLMNVVYSGPPGAGKTVSILQMNDEAFYNMIVENTTCSFEDDMPLIVQSRKRYEEAGNNLKNHILPEATKRGEDIAPYIYYVTYTDEEGRKKHMLLQFQDVDGQEYINLNWKSKIFLHNYFFLFIGADELIDGEQGLPVQYTKVVDQLIPRLRILRRDKNYEIVVIISKCDLLDRENAFLKPAFSNSIGMEGRRLKRLTHAKGFDFDAFKQRDECVRAYLKSVCPHFYGKLVSAVPSRNISFCMMASIGSVCEGNRFENYQPQFIDEPVLSILAKNAMYPIAVPEDKPKEAPVENYGVSRWKIWEKLQSVWDTVKLDNLEDDGWDDDGFDEEDGYNVDK